MEKVAVPERTESARRLAKTQKERYAGCSTGKNRNNSVKLGWDCGWYFPIPPLGPEWMEKP